jgi:Oxysterol-binding protein
MQRLDDFSFGGSKAEAEEDWLQSFTVKDIVFFSCRFTCELNEPEEGVAPTDSRLRPDQRLMEEGKWDEANVEKVRYRNPVYRYVEKTGVAEPVYFCTAPALDCHKFRLRVLLRPFSPLFWKNSKIFMLFKNINNH